MLTEITINKQALLHNVSQFRKVAGSAKLMVVVKSNAYGHGYFAVASCIEDKVDYFGVASLSEALSLREIKIKKPILVLNYYELTQVESAVLKNISLVVYDLSQVKTIQAAAKKLKKKALVHIKVGTGLSRLGVFAKDSLSFTKQVLKMPNIIVEGIFSHFAASEDDPGFTMIQLEHFRKIISELESNNIEIPIKHIACTASALAFPETHFGMIRIGIGIYGLQSYKSIYSKVLKTYEGFSLKKALTWKTKILAVKDLPVGAYVGYGRTYQTTRKTKLAILPVGYHEGYDRGLSNNSEVLINGVRCPVRGRIYMNLMSVDVTKVKNAKAGDTAVLIGTQGREEITADELAVKAGTINYEIVTRINPIIPRLII
ncbi:MAG: alanine racemase [Candidatus Doudnabacteria bacterium]|nr:alanine racemase [Candidatus Doudnabacteria bacterium]